MNFLHIASLHFHLTVGAVIFGISMTVFAVTPEPSPKEESKPLPVEQLTEAEMVQQVISNHLVNTEHDQATERTEQMSIVVGDVRRTVGLSPERQRMLEIAAKGAVDRSMEGWRSAQENQVRQQASGLPLEMVEQRLTSIGRINVGNDDTEQQSLWTGALGQLLTPEEHVTWTNAEQERQAYRQRALVVMLMAELDRQIGITLTQAEKIEPLAAAALADYMPDMMNYIDRSNGIDLRMLLLMLSGIPEATLTELIGPQQHERWMQITADYRGWWQSIEQNHRARINRPSQVNPQGGVILQNGGRAILK
ncbi:MAG: hypothetical protein ACOYOF_04530 [Verrucomicrobiaceae bacterium]